MLTQTQKEVLRLLIEIFNSNNIDFQASGGLAAIAYGAKRPLYDIDIEIYKKDVETVRELLEPYIVEDWNNDVESSEDSFKLWIMTLSINSVSVDINQVEESYVRSQTGEWIHQPETMNIELRIVGGIEIPVQARADLIAYKHIVGRDTDRIDIEQMVEADSITA
ncbi:MAG: hypothetical protein JWL75_432 [Parcubacteria group bacterium]|nr:hypothetical protein [Parcubacteria group bacterium]